MMEKLQMEIQIAYCSKVNFFGRFGVKGALPFMERNNPKTINEKQMNYMQDKVLVLIDGCFKCDSSDENGAIARMCTDEVEIISQINFNKSEGSFVIGGILNERSCPSRSQTENEAKLKPLK
uniref:Uncharacterized protein n=1 Tax=Meloidogyne javanica TaxID=6303 RepID=A0A915LTS5_MELJA